MMKPSKKSQWFWFVGLYFVSLVVFAAVVGVLHGLITL